MPATNNALTLALIQGGMEPLKSGYIGTESVALSPTRAVQNGITAAGTTIANAFVLTALVNGVSTAAASTGVQLPNVEIGVTVSVRNNGANTINIWPDSSLNSINAGGAGAAVTLTANNTGNYTKMSGTVWVSA